MCPECHAETQDHPLRKSTELVLVCKKCKRAFRKDLGQLDESDEYCPHCDNHYVVEAKTPQPIYGIEGEDARVDNRLFADSRARLDPRADFYSAEVEAQASERVDSGGVIGALQNATAAAPSAHAQARSEAQAEMMRHRATELDIHDDDLDWS